MLISVHLYMCCLLTLLCLLPFSSTGVKVEGGSSDSVDQGVVTELRTSLKRVEKELQDTKERKASLERECVIYQSQLDVSCSDYTCSSSYIGGTLLHTSLTTFKLFTVGFKIQPLSV